MPFSTSFCLTNIGNLPSNTTLSFYSNADGYTVPFQTTVPLFSVTGNNCPFTLTGVYDGTTIIKVQTSTGNCCAVINITPNDPCTFCNLGFDAFSAATIGEIVAGNITGSCSSNITDYLIEWYDVTNANSPVLKFTSGKGNVFQYIFTHPLVNTTAIPALPGLYKPFLRKIIINGIVYSYNGGSGMVQANLDCFTTVSVNVTPLNCSNGTEVGNFSHMIQFSGASQGVQPIPLSTVFQLSADTKYLAWRFWGYDIADELQFTYYGSYYNNTPIILEWFGIGNNNVGPNLSTNTFPKTTSTSSWGDDDQGGYYGKVTCLTGITISNNDYIVITIKPNILNSKTNFKLKLQCLTTFNCQTCLDNYYNTVGYKIVQSSIISTPMGCNQNNIQFSYSGCSTNNVSNSDIYKYLSVPGTTTPSTFFPGMFTDNGLGGGNLTYSLTKQSCTLNNSGFSLICATPVDGNIITFTKNNSGPAGKGNINMSFSNINDFNAYYNSYNQRLLQLGTISNDPTNINFYKGVYLTTTRPNNQTDQCGDTTNSITYPIHSSSVVTTGFTSNMYTLNITMPTITKQISFSNCQLYCDSYVVSFVTDINQQSTGSTNNLTYTNNKGNRYTEPCNRIWSIELSNNPLTGATFENGVQYSKFSNETKPFSANTNGSYSYISSMSATTCNFSRFVLQPGYPNSNLDYYVQLMASYQIKLNNPLNVNDFIIQATPLSQSFYSSTIPGFYSWSGVIPNPNSAITIYQKVNGIGTVLNPNYFI